MTGKDILEKLTEIDEALIQDAARPHRRFRGAGWIAAAACLCLAVPAVLWGWLGRTPEDLPMLTVQSSFVGGYGYEGYMAYDISELVNANPWNEKVRLSTLPVYRNAVSYDAYHIPVGTDWEAMETLLLDVAEGLGMETGNLEITDDAPDEETQKIIREKFESVGDTVPEGYFNPSQLEAEENGIKIKVDTTLTATVSFDPPVSLPEEYHFSYSSSYQEMEDAAGYLKKAYAGLLNMKKPQLNITGGDYTYSGEQSYDIRFFDKSGGVEKQIIQYNFYSTAFYCNDEGKLFLARVFRPDLSDKVGDYPVITSQEALELLGEGKYITTVPAEMPGLEYVVKTELIYRKGQGDAYYIPWYRFYVELPDMALENGLRDYGAYYVPAVEESYISDMPLWDGTFNGPGNQGHSETGALPPGVAPGIGK